jgi:branched-chain amino acid aminotransferase
MIWTQGQIVADEELRISVLDRTFEHGLGLFETFRTWCGHATLLPRHLDRLTRSARALGLPLEPDQCPDEDAVRALLKTEGRTSDARLRITLSGGLSAAHGSTLWMRASDLPPPAPAEGIRLGKAWPVRTDPLAGHKTLNYWANRLMFEDARQGGFGECVTISPDGQLWEGSMSSFFAVVDGQLLTPPCAGKALPGIMRSLILERGTRLGLDVRETPLGLFDRLFRPEEVFLTNSVRGIMPVGEWGEARFPVPGPVARRLWDDILPWLESGGATP